MVSFQYKNVRRVEKLKNLSTKVTGSRHAHLFAATTII
ncbi:hypothetical protein CIP107503_00553 [Corynebacterium diphtheriae]|uniref:Uncharacterized protein n=1 Tax=Corynebacterium diphtheriae TaxID=1717 RepID=A0A811G1N9_CORDP|nr:hypothetical protein CIP100294_00499 [Corynebacterium diphtheriae]CAB0495685.1 hypothetical protein CIP107503_00553 [Corynebacterium diphtheriae]CAB0496353.1 hypothetical protein CIP102550_00560 [Corynebacterium diphtheriae]CAB0541611.1 hypothetical protein CIP107524_00624 [Corynebacterium diphtheriae]CAB0587404.1 hypothetical protein CIP107541_00558 [Corynebacterium diphtheriae]